MIACWYEPSISCYEHLHADIGHPSAAMTTSMNYANLMAKQASKQASVLHKNDMKKLKNEMRWKMNKQYEMELI